MEARIDVHRPGAIEPHDYRDLMWYDCGGMNEPSIGVNCMKPIFDWFALKAIPGREAHSPDGMCCVLGLQDAGRKFAKTGRDHGAGKCTICGTYFRYGMVWEHIPTGDLVHLGHDCADKYSLVASAVSRKGWAKYKKEMENARAEAAKEMKRATIRNKFIEAHELKDAFTHRDDHPILKDMMTRLHRWGSLSDKQIAFAKKLAEEIKNPPPPKPEEIKVTAPEGRTTFTGTIVSCKWYDSQYGGSSKITVKIEEEDGIWLAWGTLPSKVDGNCDEQRGRTITLTGTLTHGDEPHFAFFKRPSLVEVSERTKEEV